MSETTSPGGLPREPIARAHLVLLASTLLNPVEEGPFTEDQLLEIARSNRMRLDTLIRSPTRTANQWLPAERVSALAAVIQKAERDAESKKERDVEDRRQRRMEGIREREKMPIEKELAKNETAPAPPEMPETTDGGQFPEMPTPQPAPDIAPREMLGAARFHPQRWLVLAASIAGIVGAALPWWQAPVIGSINGLTLFEVELAPKVPEISVALLGALVILGFLPSLAICFAEPLEHPMGVSSFLICGIGAAVSGGVAILLVVRHVLSWIGRAARVSSLEMGDMPISIGLGLILIPLAAAVCILALIAFPSGGLRYNRRRGAR